MITTTETYNPYATVRDIDMVVTYPIVSETAATNATYTVTSKETFSDLSQLNNVNYTDTKYATCEDGLVMLDGSFRFLPDVLSTEQIGWWSNTLSSENTNFYPDQVFQATLSQKDSVVGFSVYFSKTNPIRSCKITTYEDSTQLFSEIFYPSNNELIVDLPTSNFNRVEISNIGMEKPNRRVKLLGFQFGIIKRWNRNQIVSASIEELSDYTGNTLPINTLKVEFDNSTREFDLFRETRKYVYREAMSRAQVSATNSHSLAMINQVKNANATAFNYATCENDFVILDKGYVYLPDSTVKHIGYLNNALSDTNGEFSSNPTITYEWDENISISGFKLYFYYKNYATEFKITGYNNNNVILTKTYQNIEDIIIWDAKAFAQVVDAEFDVSGCNRIVFEFESVKEKNRFVKVSKIQVMRYVDSWGSYLTKRQKIIAEFVVNGERISMGDSYLFDSLKQINGGLTAEITAKSDVVYLDNQKHDGEHGTTTLGTAMSSVLSGTDVSTIYIPSTLANTTVSKATPKDTTKRAATHYFAQAAQATCFFDREGVLNIRALEIDDFVDTIDITNMYDKDIARMGEYVNMIRLTVKDEYTDPETSNTYYGGSGLYYRELQNNCVYSNNGTSVAQWLLKQYQRRVYFKIIYRGNPALELGDTIRIITADGTSYLAVIYEQLFEYDGGLICTIKAVEASQD